MPFNGGASYGQQIDQWTRARTGPTLVPTGAAAIVGTAQKAGRVVNFRVANPNAAARTITTYIVPKGGVAGPGNIYDHRSVAAASPADLLPADNYLHLNAGDQIFMLSSGADPTVTISVEVEK